MRVNLLATRFFAPNYKTRLNDEPEPTTETTTTTNQQHLSSNDLMSSQSANKDVAFKGAVINEFIAGRATAEELAHKFVAIIPDIQAKLKLMAPENTVEIHSTLAPLREIFSDVSSHPGDIIDAFIQRTDLYEKVYKEALKVRAYRQPTPNKLFD